MNHHPKISDRSDRGCQRGRVDGEYTPAPCSHPIPH